MYNLSKIAYSLFFISSSFLSIGQKKENLSVYFGFNESVLSQTKD